MVGLWALMGSVATFLGQVLEDMPGGVVRKPSGRFVVIRVYY